MLPDILLYERSNVSNLNAVEMDNGMSPVIWLYLILTTWRLFGGGNGPTLAGPNHVSGISPVMELYSRLIERSVVPIG